VFFVTIDGNEEVADLASEEIRLIRRGVPRREYIEYFQSLGKEAAPGHFSGPNWEVILSDERSITVMAACCVLETELVFRGEAERVRQMVDAFRLKFMRAGA
jgi:hypothetical protein